MELTTDQAQRRKIPPHWAFAICVFVGITVAQVVVPLVIGDWNLIAMVLWYGALAVYCLAVLIRPPK